MDKKHSYKVLAFIFLISSCAVDTSPENSGTISGKVTNVTTGGLGGEKDITIALEANDTLYYINRGLEKFKLKSLRDSLVNSSISLTYAKDLLQPTFKHITEIQKDNRVLFTE